MTSLPNSTPIEISEERFTCYYDKLDSIKKGKHHFEKFEKPPKLREALYNLGITDQDLLDDIPTKAKKLVRKAKSINGVSCLRGLKVKS